jgi:ABC-type phosphate/phosphonate transport system permease subunit
MSQDTPSAASAPKRRRWLRWTLLAVLLVLIGGATYGYNKVAPYARIGGTYIAKQYCSCLFVTGRSEASCKAEFKPDIDRFTVSVDRSGLPAKASVKTRLAIFSAEATYDSRYGCTVAK